MKKSNLKRIFAAFIAGVSMLSFAACNVKHEDDNPPGSDSNIPGTTPSEDEDGEGKPTIPVNPVAGSVKIIAEKTGGDLESAYVCWEIDENAKWYNVYVKENGADDSQYKQLDRQLVRKYKTYFRADAVGLKAGAYDIKVVPVKSDDTEAAEQAGTVQQITVKPHDRSGFGFVNGTSSGAYNEDGSLKDSARVIYVTDKTKDTVTLDVPGAGTVVGVQNIITANKKKLNLSPLVVRFIGNVTDPANMPKGDLYIDSVSNVTFEGIGSDATLNGFGLVIKSSSNVEVRNLGFMNCNSTEGDDVGLQQANDHIWVHNCDFFYGDAGSDADQIKGDGALDTKKSTYVTHSYNHFWDNGKCNLQGMKDETVDNFITYHHNWYDHSDSRHPRIRTCTVHVYNNYFDGNAKYGVGATMGSSVFVENNYFRNDFAYKPMLISMQGTDVANSSEGTFSSEDGGIIKSYGNTFAGSGTPTLVKYSENNVDFDCYEATSADEAVPSTVKTKQGGTTYNNFDTSTNMYEYTAQSPEDAKALIEKYAGRVSGGDLVWEFDDATEDKNYAVITELKKALTDYKSELLLVGGEDAASSGDTPTVPPTPDIPGVSNAVTAFFTGENGTATDPAFVVTGSNKKAQSFTVHAINKTLEQGLKMESATTITVNLEVEMTLCLYVDGAVGKRVKVDGEKKASVTVGQDNVITVVLKAGTHTITKGDSINLYYATLTPIT